MTRSDPPRRLRQAGPRRTDRRPLLAAGVAAAAILLGALGAAAGFGGGASSPPPSTVAIGGSVAPRTPAASTPAPASSVAPSVAPSTAPPVTPAPLARVAVVPVTQFRTPYRFTTGKEVRDVLAGTSERYEALELVTADADAILAALGLDRPSDPDRLVLADDATDLATDLAKHRTRLGFLRAEEIDPSVRALGWDGTALFGVGHVEGVDDWKLVADLPRAGDATYDPGGAWTLVAGGDVMLDRGVALALKKRGADFMFDGGTVDITGRCKDCSAFGWDLPYTKRTGNKGVVREYVEGADLAIANFENPAPDSFRFHGRGTVFSANPAYIEGLANAGIDWVGLANNHIGDAGRNGIVQTMRNLDKHGIAHSGSGRNSDEAHEAALVDVGAVTVGLIAYDSIARSYNAGESTPGSARFTAAGVKRDVAAAREAGADVVIVFPHWGIEYRATPSSGQRTLAHAAIDAGADMVIGNHAHWAAAMEVYEGKPIWYALGNLVFDQTWSEPTMEGITLELTFDGTRLVQAGMRPHLILDKAQPNFLDPAGDGKVVMNQLFGASKGLLPW